MLSVNAQVTHWRKPRGYAKITLPVYATKAHAMSELLSLLTDLVAIDSVNPDLVPGGAGEGRTAKYIAGWGRANALEVHVQEAGPGRPNVILIVRGRGGGLSLAVLTRSVFTR